MKFNKLICGLLLLTLLLTGCTSEPDEIIRVDIRNKENDQFETLKTILDLDKVTKVKDILNKVRWQKGNWGTTKNPDFIVYFYTEEDDTGKQDPAAVYQLYVGFNDTRIVVVTDSEKYAKLSYEDSQRLMTTLTTFENE